MAFVKNSILEKHLQRGQQLYDSGAVQNLDKQNTDLWLLLIRDEDDQPVQIKDPLSKMPTISCKCQEFIKLNSCNHVATAYYQLQNIEQELKVLPITKPRKIESFNIRSIMERANHAELKLFIKDYAKKDRTFGILIKAHFASKIDLKDNSQKYSSILNSLIKPVSTKSNSSTSSEIRLALKVIEEFKSQMEDALSIEKYDEAFYIIVSCLPKIHYLYSNYKMNSEKIQSILLQFHTNLNFLYGERLAPNLLQKLDSNLLDLYKKSYYNHLDTLPNLFHIASNHNRVELLSELSLYIKNLDPINVRLNDLAVVVGIKIQVGQTNFDKLSEDAILNATQFLVSIEEDTTAISFMEKYLEVKPKSRKIQYALFAAYLRQKNIERFRSIGAQLYVQNRDNRYYRSLKEHIPPSDWKATKKIIQQNMSEHQASSSFMANFFFNEEMHKELIALMEEERDLRHIMKYDFHLYQNDFVALERIYHRAIHLYLESHAGTIAMHFVEEILHHLYRIRAHKMTSSLKQYIADHFPHRQLLSSFS